jgi:hypothetical protein
MSLEGKLKREIEQWFAPSEQTAQSEQSALTNKSTKRAEKEFLPN